MKKKIDWRKVILMSALFICIVFINVVIGLFTGWSHVLQGLAGALSAFGILMLFMYLIMKKQKKNEKS